MKTNKPDIDECESSPCKHGATCVDLVNDYQCNCAPGYSGSNCEIDIDECANSPCQNGGECIDKINEFYCKCEAGYNGTLCEIDINECRSKNCDNKTPDLCLSSPCKNNGTCESGETWFLCSCAHGFDGLTCQININECASQPCAEGSTCIDGIGSFKCICPPSKRGKRCEICKYILMIITYSFFVFLSSFFILFFSFLPCYARCDSLNSLYVK